MEQIIQAAEDLRHDLTTSINDAVNKIVDAVCRAEGNGDNHSLSLGGTSQEAQATMWETEGVRGKCLCTICTEDDVQLSIQSLECGHSFHKVCLTRWKSLHPTCPLCRHQVV